MALDTLEMPGHPIEPPREGCFEPVGTVRRQMRGERRLHDQGLRHALAGGVIGQLDGEIRWQPEGVLGPHGSYAQIVGAIERCLPRNTEAMLEEARLLRVVI